MDKKDNLFDLNEMRKRKEKTSIATKTIKLGQSKYKGKLLEFRRPDSLNDNNRMPDVKVMRSNGKITEIQVKTVKKHWIISFLSVNVSVIVHDKYCKVKDIHKVELEEYRIDKKIILSKIEKDLDLKGEEEIIKLKLDTLEKVFELDKRIDELEKRGVDTYCTTNNITELYKERSSLLDILRG